jgi:hypothetical protein
VNKGGINVLLILGLILLLGGGGYAVYEMTRGLRNNNPGNIVYDANNDWLGQTGTDGTFAVFSNPIYGIRAMSKTLLNYVNRDGVAPTVDSIIRRWSKTDQDAYSANVSAALGVSPLTVIDVTSSLPELVKAITRQENGTQPYDDATINQGVSLALS